MQEMIQRIVFPANGWQWDHSALYYRGIKGVFKRSAQDPVLYLPEYSSVDFCTYFNEVSNGKWQKYTGLRRISLELTLKGSMTVRLTGYHKEGQNIQKTVFSVSHFNLTEPAPVHLEFPETADTLVGFEIDSETACEFHGGTYLGEFETERDITLAIASTTCHKEKDIQRNVNSIKQNLLDSDHEIASHLYLHVIDNGNTLRPEDLPSDPRIKLHSNRNTGGSGGYARGMMECLHQKPAVTHVLIMDDDVVVQPESILKTYILLRHLKAEYQESFISGALLCLEKPNLQWEDIGYLREDGFCSPLKPHLYQDKIGENIRNETFPTDSAAHKYAGWWYCVIPASVIRKNGLPLPLFIRGDDVEYALRCNTGILSMNGICVWHFGFGVKFNTLMDHYQASRNLLIGQAVNGTYSNVPVFHKAKMDIRKDLLRLNYDDAELDLRALEDFLKGPGFIAKADGEQIIKNSQVYIQKMLPIEEIGGSEQDLENLCSDCSIPRLERLLYKITLNGHLFYFGSYKKAPVAIPSADEYMPGKIAFRSRIYEVNAADETACVLERDNARFLKLLKRYCLVLIRYRLFGKLAAARYRSAKKYFTSERFWKKYLGLQ